MFHLPHGAFFSIRDSATIPGAVYVHKPIYIPQMASTVPKNHVVVAM